MLNVPWNPMKDRRRRRTPRTSPRTFTTTTKKKAVRRPTATLKQLQEHLTSSDFFLHETAMSRMLSYIHVQTTEWGG